MAQLLPSGRMGSSRKRSVERREQPQQRRRPTAPEERPVTQLWIRIEAALRHAQQSPTSVESRLVEAGVMTRGGMSKYKFIERENPDARAIEGIADVCGVDFHWLLLGRGTMLPARTPAVLSGKFFDSDPPPGNSDIIEKRRP